MMGPLTPKVFWSPNSAGHLGGTPGGTAVTVNAPPKVTLMITESVGFLWYSRRVTPWATVGYVLGILVYTGQRAVGW